MREDICSIPVNDVFLPKDGCPFCRMRDMLEDRMATYITGAAMMEPDIRVETNRLGFCKTHFDQILARGSRLSVALILESLLAEVRQEAFPPGKYNGKKLAQVMKARGESCFICQNIDTNFSHLMENTVKLWQNDPDFRQLFSQQPLLCFTHYGQLMAAAEKKLKKKEFAPFQEESARLAARYAQELNGDVTHFTKMFDYRNANGDWCNSRDSIERAITWLTGREPEAHQSAGEKNR